MQKDIAKKLSKARLRLALNKLLEICRRVLLFAAIVAVMAVAAERLLAVELLTWPISGAFLALCGVIVLICWLANLPSRKTASLLIDEKLRLKERMSSLMSLETRDDPFAQAACREATETIQQVSLQHHFPVTVSRNWFYSLGLWATVGLMAAFFPQYDLLGSLQRQEDETQQAQELQLAEKTVKLTASAVKMAVKQLGDDDLTSELEALEAMTSAQSPEAVKRQAIAKLGNLSDKIKQLEAGLNKDALTMTKKMLRQLKPMSDAFSQKLQQAIAKGDWGQARDLVKQFQQQLEQGQLSDEQKQQLSEQMANLAKQLEQIAAQNKALEDDLAKQGLDKKLANLSEEQLRQALQQQGLSPEQIERLMQKFSACNAAGKNCSNLAGALAACGGIGGMNADGFSDLAAQLSDLEAFQQQMNLMEASLDEIENAIGYLGEGICGSGCSGCSNGCSLCQGGGKGGLRAGTGIGANTLDDVDTSGMKTKSTKVINEKRQPGPIVASWYFKGEQIKGQSSRKLDEVIQTAGHEAAEAINNHEIPRRYEESVKNYFKGLTYPAQENP